MNPIFSKIDIKSVLKNTAFVVFGTLILAFGTAVFVIPFNLVVGGVSGLGIILSKIIAVDFLSVNVIITSLTWLTFFLGLFILGKAFDSKTLVSTIIYPPALSLFSKLASPDAFDGFFYLSAESEANLIIASLFIQ